MEVTLIGESHDSVKDKNKEMEIIREKKPDYVIHEGLIDEEYYSDSVPSWFAYLDRQKMNLISNLYEDCSKVKLVARENSKLIHTRKNNDVFYDSTSSVLLFLRYVFFGLIILCVPAFLLGAILMSAVLVKYTIVFFAFAIQIWLILKIKTGLDVRDTREDIMANRIKSLPEESTVVVIVGESHIRGLEDRLESESLSIVN